MVAISSKPLLTHLYSGVNTFVPAPDSYYVHGVDGEERNAHSAKWEANAGGVTFVRIDDQRSSRFSYTIGAEKGEVQVRSSSQVVAFTSKMSSKQLYVDITGLSHHVWAPLLKAIIGTRSQVKVVYVEPSGYRFSVRPTEGDIFDLSEKINGISPLPGFTVLEDNEDDVCFVPLLGFEGPRFAYVLEQVQPPGERIFPVIGIPGFRIQYPFYTYEGNRPALKDTQSWKEVRFAAANCPFSLIYLLRDIADEQPNATIKIAPIGTKPHALGAVLFTLQSNRRVEIVYDHPVRKKERTEGTDRLLVYDVGRFLSLTF
jgi:hypothetical protein